MDIFMGLILDLFPGIDVPRNRNFEFEEIISKAGAELRFWPEPNFIEKIV